MRTAKYYATTEESFEIVTWHSWGQMGDQDGLSYPAAIIEKSDGEVIVTDADRIRFIEPYNQSLDSDTKSTCD